MEIIIVILAFIFGSESEMRKTVVNIEKIVANDVTSFNHRVAQLDEYERELAYMADYVAETMHYHGGMTWNEAVSYRIADIQEAAKGSAWAGDEEKLCSMYQSLYI
mgnify:FL=1